MFSPAIIKKKKRNTLVSVMEPIIKKVKVTSIGDTVDKRAPLYTVDRNVNYLSHQRKQHEIPEQAWLELP